MHRLGLRYRVNVRPELRCDEPPTWCSGVRKSPSSWTAASGTAARSTAPGRRPTPSSGPGRSTALSRATDNDTVGRGRMAGPSVLGARGPDSGRTTWSRRSSRVADSGAERTRTRRSPPDSRTGTASLPLAAYHRYAGLAFGSVGHRHADPLAFTWHGKPERRGYIRVLVLGGRG